jgi:hypothetical protein
LDFRWSDDKIPGIRPLSDEEERKLAQFQRRPFALSKRERAQLIKFLRMKELAKRRFGP